ncbi:sulfate ABC transporter substrate-binding protein [Planotetraspora sp. A-T 1434]|uniref:sulfate ABC transporter substrate-binding protein n=1 Tax=Planotetraspora sp. A-T 1434 TaxID=2979219 RepID=UPI0021BF428D|nr:sulfate ABC transporter substrate-binding protein [Planotetraspora sp. A-T 1434]MCT9929859.1 sulfate ABC transporter substrate-binding protein [Planotetraspora sp. A-T 1434]
MIARGLALSLVALAPASCGQDGSPHGNGRVTLSLVAYSTPKAAYQKIIDEFARTPEGRNIRFEQSYGASGDQSRAVEAGAKADVVAFSLEPDITRLVEARLVAGNWHSDQYGGMVTDSVVVIATREGNPKGLKTWRDLLAEGVEVITPNPFVSGSARWNILAGYGAESGRGARRADGIAYLRALFSHVPVQDSSARGSLQTFNSGMGDALLAYENEVFSARQGRRPLDYVVPDATILIENPVAVTTTSEHPDEAKAFVRFLRTPAAQRIFAENGYRPVLPELADPKRFPVPSKLFTVKDLGGWPKINKEFFDPETGVIAGIEGQQ